MKVTKGMKVSTLNLDGTISRGKVIGVGVDSMYADARREQTASVVFDDFNGHVDVWADGWFTEMYAADLNPFDHVYTPECECGNMLSMCHPEA